MDQGDWMDLKTAFAGAVVTLTALLALASSASANSVVSEFGEGAGQTQDPRGLAVDTSTGTLYVADAKNNRVDVFDASGEFTMAFGWGVANGAVSFQTCTTSCRAGIAGAGSGQFSRPSAIAVDDDPASPSFHSVYVFDSDNLRVQKFSAASAFVLTFGGGVNKTDGSDICTAASKNVCGAGSRGSGPGEFGFESRPIAVGAGGQIFVADAFRSNTQPEEFENRIEKFEDSGAFAGDVAIPADGVARSTALAVDSAERIYLFLEGEGGTGLRQYDGAGNLVRTLPSKEANALAVDAEDHLFVAETGGEPLVRRIAEYDSSGVTLRRFAYEFPVFNSPGLAPFQSSSGDIYADEEDAGPGAGSRVLHVSLPPPGPVILSRPCEKEFVGNTRANVVCLINPEGKATTAHFEYIDQTGFENGGFENPATEESPESGSIGEDFELQAAPLTLEGLLPETTYHFRVVATNADGGPFVGPESTFTTKPPLELGDSWVSEVEPTSARLNAEVNPLSLPTTGFFEYVDQASFEATGFAGAQKAPDVGGGAEPIDFGEAEALTSGSAAFAGLAPGTLYRYRLVATDKFVTVHGPEQLFKTPTGGALALPDDRAYEMVSPGQKASAEAGNSESASGGLKDVGFTTIQQGAPGGEAFTFTSFTSFGDPKSAPGASQYLSRRSSNGWSTRNITPAGHGGNPLQPPFRGFTPDLSLGAVAVQEPPLTPEADPDNQNLYLQNDDSGALQLLSAGTPKIVPLEGRRYCVGFGGATADGQRALLLASGALTENAPVAAGFSLYEWSAAEGVQLVSVLPGEVPAQPSATNGFGASGLGCSVGQTIVRNAISSDGSRIFWTFVPKAGASRLLARLGGTETVQLDAKQGGPGNAGGGRFQAASADGSKVVFTDASRLVPGAHENDLYRYDFEAAPGSRLTDLTLSTQTANAQGLLGTSTDTSSIYFVATGALTEVPNQLGDKATNGGNNLYLWREGEGIEFIATLAKGDSKAWSPEPREQNARVSPDGSAVAFLSGSSLTGYDNTVEGAPGCQPEEDGSLAGSPSCDEVFLFDAGSGELSCASCNPSFARPLGPSKLPAWTSPFQQPRYLSADGSRLFFQTRDGLDPHDTNGRGDVYELERVGSGSCAADSATFNSLAGGCVFLISGGTSSDEAFLLDASEDGSDAFFSTRDQLVGGDEDERYDVYDARVGGGFPEPPPPAEECGGESCRPAVEPPPGGSPPGSSGPSEGNVKEGHGQKPVRCKKGAHRVRKHGKVRCVKNARKRRGAGR